MTLVDYIIAAGIIITVVERIINIIKNQTKSKKSKEKFDTALQVLETTRTALSECQDSASIFIKAIEKAPPEISTPLKSSVKTMAVRKGLLEVVDNLVQSVVQSK